MNMQTEALFEDIAERIHLELERAEHSIYIAVAWFTKRYLLCPIGNANL